jgi:hypothetical protein
MITDCREDQMGSPNEEREREREREIWLENFTDLQEPQNGRD